MHLSLFIYVALHPLHLIAQLKWTANSTCEDVREERHRNVNLCNGFEADNTNALVFLSNLNVIYL